MNKRVCHVTKIEIKLYIIAQCTIKANFNTKMTNNDTGRPLTPGSKNYNGRRGDLNDKIMTGDYSESYFSDKAGGYYLAEKSNAKHPR